MSDEKILNNTPFFIVGSGRSGSTLLRMIISAHSRLAIPPETHYIIPLVQKFSQIKNDLTPDEVKIAIEIITSHYRWPDFKMERSFLEAAISELSTVNLRSILDIVYEEQIRSEGKKVWGDKTPLYINILPELIQLYPDAKFINLVRDGRDVTESFRRTGWCGPWLYKNTSEWKQSIISYHNAINAGLSARILNIKYEDLVRNTQTTIEVILEFLGESFEPEMLEWEQDVTEKIPAREAHIHKKLLRKPNINDIERWKLEMTPRQVLVVESFIYKELKNAGYKLKFNNILFRLVFPFVRLFCISILPMVTFALRVKDFILHRIK